MIDSHCHLDRIDLAPFGGTMDGFVAAMKEAGVARMLCVGIDLEHFPTVRALAGDYREVDCSVGVHPSEREGAEPSVDDIVRLADDPCVVAIGETGLDYFHCDGDLAWQHERFRTHIRAARQAGKPVIVHMRDATDDTMAILADEGVGEIGGVMHCFTGDAASARRALDLGLHISFSGIVTFRSAGSIREAAAIVPDDRLLIETDAPYLAPDPFRGKPNHPGLLSYIAARLAEVRGTTVEQIDATTTENYGRLFQKD